MPDSLRWTDAVLAGLGSSMRTTAGPAMLAAHGRITGKPRIAVLVATAGELATDKTSAATDRTDIPALAGRVVAGAYTGRVVAGDAGGAVGAISAAVGTFATWRIRGIVVETTGLPDPVVAVAEDVVSIGLAAIGTRPDPEPGETSATPDPFAPADASAHADGSGAAPSSVDDSGTAAPSSLLRDAGIGLFAGIVGTAAMTIAQGAEFVLTDAEPSNSPSDVVDRIKRRSGHGRLKRSQRRVANQGMHWLYGTSWGIPYGLVAARSTVAPEVSGPIFGLLVWTAALAHEPALGMADVPWKRSLQSLGSEALFHLVYGIGAGAALRAVWAFLEAPPRSGRIAPLQLGQLKRGSTPSA